MIATRVRLCPKCDGAGCELCLGTGYLVAGQSVEVDREEPPATVPAEEGRR